jgi:hypothetical protein
MFYVWMNARMRVQRKKGRKEGRKEGRKIERKMLVWRMVVGVCVLV